MIIIRELWLFFQNIYSNKLDVNQYRNIINESSESKWGLYEYFQKKKYVKENFQIYELCKVCSSRFVGCFFRRIVRNPWFLLLR